VSDTLLRPWYFRWLYGLFAECSFGLVVRSEATEGDEIGKLVGRVYLVAPAPRSEAADLWQNITADLARSSGGAELPWRDAAKRVSMVESLDTLLTVKSWAVSLHTRRRSAAAQKVTVAIMIEEATVTALMQ
jgi:hypothetical protein